MSEELTATLVVGRSSARCGNCRKPTLASSSHHTDISGYSPVRGGGCGARFVNMRADYSAGASREELEAELKGVRSDLPIIDQL